jgi:hypothetical protein
MQDKTKWEEEFDKKFYVNGTGCYAIDVAEYKKFISSLINELRDRVEKLDINDNGGWAYNPEMAKKEIINIFKDYETK